MTWNMTVNDKVLTPSDILEIRLALAGHIDEMKKRVEKARLGGYSPSIMETDAIERSEKILAEIESHC